MKTLLFGFLALACGPAMLAQPAAPPALPQRTPDQLEELLGPIALYPDPLIAVILPASTTPSELVLAARFVQRTNDPAAIDAQPWDESVKAVAHYPELITWLDQNLEWTQQLGAAFLDQPADVMNAVQRLRARARAAGILVDTPQQQVVVQQEVIYIEPAQPDIIYVPVYDPQIFYHTGPWPRSRSYLTFGTGFSVGPWLAFDFDWSRRTVWIDRRDWSQRRTWRAPAQTQVVVASPERRAWRPRVDAARRPPAPAQAIRAEVVRPTPLAAAQTVAPQPNAPSRSRPAVPQPPAATSPSTEPARTPTGRPSEPRAERRARTEALPEAAPPPASAPTPRPAPAPITTAPERAAPRESRGRSSSQPIAPSPIVTPSREATPPVTSAPAGTTQAPARPSAAPEPPRATLPAAPERQHVLPAQAAPPARTNVPPTVPAPQAQSTPTPPTRQPPPPPNKPDDDDDKKKRDR